MKVWRVFFRGVSLCQDDQQQTAHERFIVANPWQARESAVVGIEVHRLFENLRLPPFRMHIADRPWQLQISQQARLIDDALRAIVSEAMEKNVRFERVERGGQPGGEC